MRVILAVLVMCNTACLVTEGDDNDDIILIDQENSPLHIAAFNGQVEEVQELLNTGADPCATNRNLVTPLHNAAASGNLSTVKALRSVSDLNVQDDNDSTALHVALAFRHENVAIELIKAGASVNISGYKGATPLYVAARTGCERAVTELLVHGADPCATTDDGEHIISIGNQKIMHQLHDARLKKITKRGISGS